MIKITQITFTAGRSDGELSLAIDVPTVLLLVGPNNCGKSTALYQLKKWCDGGSITGAGSVVADAHTSIPLQDDFDSLVNQLGEVGKPESPAPRHMWLGQPGGMCKYTMVAYFPPSGNGRDRSQEENMSEFRQAVIKPFTLSLTSQDAIETTESKSAKPVNGANLAADNILHLMVNNNSDLRTKVRDVVREALGFNLCVSLITMPDWSLWGCKTLPGSEIMELSAADEARNFYKKQCIPVARLGQGYRAFLGFVMSLFSFHHRILIVDEPETYLHPPLVRRLAKVLTSEISNRDGTLVVATHSSDFVFSCLEESQSVAIVRLTHNDGIATARALLPSELQALFQNPQIRNSKVIDGLFHENVVVVEGDSDRVFYEEINRRLNRQNRGAKDCLFLHGNGIINSFPIARALRRVGIPSAVIVDFDYLFSGRKFDLYFDQISVPESRRQKLLDALTRAQDVLSLRRQRGEPAARLNDISGSEAFTVGRAIVLLRHYGVFVVPVGKVEDFMPDVEIRKPKKDWVKRVFDSLGTEEKRDGYATPAESGVWKFIDGVGKWCSDGARLGL